MPILKGGGGNAGIIAPPITPILTWAGYSSNTFTFGLQNFSNNFNYSLSTTLGTIAINNSGQITVSGPSNDSDFNISVIIRSVKGNLQSNERIASHKRYTFTPDTRYSYACGTYSVCGNCNYVPSNGSPCGPGTCPGGYSCDNPNWCVSCSCQTYTRYCSGGSAPSLITETDFVNYGSGWYKL